MSFGFANILNILARQAGQNQGDLLRFNRQQSTGIFNNRGLGIATQLFAAADRVSITAPRFVAGPQSSFTPIIPQQLFSDIATEIGSTEDLINNLEPASIDEDLSQVRFLFGLTKALAEIQQASHRGSKVTNESNGSAGIDSQLLKTRADAIFDTLVKDGQALDLAIQEIDDRSLRSQLLTIQDEISALLTANNAGDSDKAVALANQAIDLLPESVNDIFDSFQTTSLKQTSENLLEFGFGVSRALADLAQGEFEQENPNSSFLTQINRLFERFNVGDGSFNEEILDRTSDSTLFKSLEQERLELQNLDVNTASDLPSIRASLNDVFRTFRNSPNTNAPPTVDSGNPGGIAPGDPETLEDIEAAIRQNTQDIQNLIDNSGITDEGVLSALQDVITELQTINFQGSEQDALDVLASARELLDTAQNTEPEPIVTNNLIARGERDFGAGVASAFNNAANRILSEGQAAAEADALAAQLRASLLEDIFNVTANLALRTSQLLEDEQFSSSTNEDSPFSLNNIIF